MKQIRNMKVWPTIDKEKAGATEIVEEDHKEDIKPFLNIVYTGKLLNLQ